MFQRHFEFWRTHMSTVIGIQIHRSPQGPFVFHLKRCSLFIYWYIIFVINFIYQGTLDNCHLYPMTCTTSFYGFIFLFTFEGGIMCVRAALPHITCARCEWARASQARSARTRRPRTLHVHQPCTTNLRHLTNTTRSHSVYNNRVADKLTDSAIYCHKHGFTVIFTWYS